VVPLDARRLRVGRDRDDAGAGVHRRQTKGVSSHGRTQPAARGADQRGDISDYYASGEEWRWYSASSFVVHAETFRQIGGFAPAWINGEDADLAMRLGTAGGFVQVVAPATFGYRDHSGSLVSQTRRTLEGVQYALRMEQQHQYPGGAARARERRVILTRQFVR
jgi:GT2 family glycosyltransferase